MPESFAVQLTPPAPGAIAVILLTGPDALPILQQLTHPSPGTAALAFGKFIRVNLYNFENSKLETRNSKIPLDDALLIHTAPNRYELHLHGGTAVVTAVLQALAAAGATLLTLEQAAAHGLLGNPLDADLQLALSLASTPTALRLLLAQPANWHNWAQHWRNHLETTPRDTSPWQLHSAAQWLLLRTKTLTRFLCPPRIAIIGPPNAGKSTLANALIARPTSIISDLVGTTRDWVDSPAILSTPSPLFPEDIQLRVTLVDTAGIHTPNDELEAESIRRTHQQAAAADAIIFLFDATRPATPEELALPDRYKSTPHVLALNKIDATPSPLHLVTLSPCHAATPISAKTHQGLKTLMSVLLQKLNLHELTPAEPFAFTTRQRQILKDITQSPDPTACQNLLSTFLPSQI